MAIRPPHYKALCPALAVCIALMAGPASGQSPPANAAGDPGRAGLGWEPHYPSTPLPRIGKGTFKFTIVEPVAPLPINTLEQLTISVSDARNVPVANAAISVCGRAREVTRNLPTAPQVTKNLGGGKYMVEGLRFNMSGSWLLEFEIAAGSLKDKALLELQAK